MTHYPPPRQTRRRFPRLVAVIAMALVSIVVLFWPTRARQAEHQLTSVAESLSCDGPLREPRRTTVRELLHSQFAPWTMVKIEGPTAVDANLSRDQLLEHFAELCSLVTRLRVELSHVSLDITEQGNTAQARADLSLTYQFEGRTENEHHQARFTLRWAQSSYQLTSAVVLPKVISQPEPRP